MIRYYCPTCGKTFKVESAEQAPYRPFCSERCKWIDLGKWFDEEYVISDPLNPAPDEMPPPSYDEEEH